MKNKTLEATIMAMDENEVLYIGAATSFIFIGTKKKWEEDKARLNEKHHKRFEDLESNSQSRFNKALGDIVDAYCAGKSDAYFGLVDTMAECTKTIRECREYLNNWTDLETRKVTDIHERFQQDGTVIIIDGKEAGGYWFKEEYDKKCGKNNPILKGYSRRS